MNHLQAGRYFANTKDCSESDRKTLSDYIVFPYGGQYVFDFTEDTISEIYYSSTKYIIGGYVVKIISQHKLIYLTHLGINPGLKSRSYGKDIFNRIEEIGKKIYNKEFKGIVASSFCQKTKKSLDEKNAYKLRSAINSGGKIVVECAKVGDNFLHFVYIKNERGYDEREIKEIYKEIFPY